MPDCGKCTFCRDMIKFGGSGRSKQACVHRRYVKRQRLLRVKLLTNVASPHILSRVPPSLPPILRCPNMAVQVAEECEEEDADMAENDPDLKTVVSPMLHVLCVQWLLKVLCVCVFYRR